MAKHQRKVVSSVLAALMVASMCVVPATAVTGTNQQSAGSAKVGSTASSIASSSSLADNDSTNGTGFGKDNAVTMNGDVSGGDSSKASRGKSTPAKASVAPVALEAQVTGEKSVTVKAGDTVTFTVDAKTSKKIGAYKITTNYDASALALDTTYSKDGVDTLGSSKGIEAVNTETAGKIRAAVLGPADCYTAKNSTAIQTVRFTAKKAGTYNISYTIDEMLDDNDNDLVVNAKPVSGLSISQDAAVESGTVDSATGSTKVAFKAGDTVIYKVDFKFAEKLYGFRTDINYDSSLLTVDSVSFPNFSGMTQSRTEEAGLISTIGVATPTATYDFTTQKNLITVSFVAKKSGTATISYKMKEAIALDAENQYNSQTGQPVTTKVSSDNSAVVSTEAPTEAPTVAPTEAPTEDMWVTAPTTASKEISVKKGDKVAYWAEVNIPKSGKDVAGWVVDFLYDGSELEYDSSFATAGYACGTAAIDYAIGNTAVSAELPGGSMLDTKNTKGRNSFVSVVQSSMGLNNGSTQKLICVQYTAKETGTVNLSYRLREMCNSDMSETYVNSKYQAANGAKFGQGYKVISGEQPTEAPTVAPTEAPTEAPTVAPTEAPTEDMWVTAPTTASKGISVKKGDKVAYWAEVNIPKSGKDVAGWIVDFLYDGNELEYDSSFATAGYACGTAAIDYAIGNTAVSAELPGGSMLDTKNTKGRNSFVSVVQSSMGLNNGSTQKLICVQYTAKETGTVNLSYRLREMCNSDMSETYVNSKYQAANGAKFGQGYKVISGEQPTEAPTVAPTEAPTVAPTEAPTEAPTVAPTEAPTEQPTQMPTTATTEVTVKKGDKIDYWVELILPSTGIDISGWTVDMFYDKDKLEINKEFAENNGYASGTAQVDYALGDSNVRPSVFPGDIFLSSTEDHPGEAVYCNVKNIDDLSQGLNYNTGTVQKLICLQFIAKEDCTTTLSYRMRELCDINSNSETYVDDDKQPINGASFEACVRVEPKVLIGDLDGDGSVTLADYTLICTWYTDINRITVEQFKLADINGDGRFTIGDISMLKNMVS